MEPIFLLGCHKSGTSLLRNLLDGHDDLFVIPIESHFFQNLRFWVDYRFRRSTPKELTREEIIVNLVNWIKHCNNSKDPNADSITFNSWNIDMFEKKIYKANFSNWRELFDEYVNAMHYSLYESMFYSTKKRFVEKSVENAEFACILKGMYPKCKFVHIIRNPYSTLVAIRKYKTRNNYPFLRDALLTMYNSYYYLYKNKAFLSDYFIIRYEDLVSFPEKYVERIIDFLGIKFSDILYTPTQFGEEWSGNSTSGNKFSGISAESLYRWQKDVTNFEIHMVNKLFPFILKDYDYEMLKPSKSFLGPIKGEKKKTYIKNRALWYIL